MNYNNKRFRVISNSENGQVNSSTIFEYKQENNILTCSYSGENIERGHLIGIVTSNGIINMAYHQIDSEGKLMTGKCISTPEQMPNGKIRLHEKWQWTSGDKSSGTSTLEEI